jgi:hypothetical protein
MGGNIRNSPIARKWPGTTGQINRFRTHSRPATAETPYVPAKVEGDYAPPLPASEWRAMLAGELRRLTKQVEWGLPIDLRSVRTAFQRLSEIAA